MKLIISTFRDFEFITIFQKNSTQQKKENEESKSALNKTNVITVMPTKRTQTNEKLEKSNKLAVIAKLFAWYINPVIYVLFSVLYFLIGPYY